MNIKNNKGFLAIDTVVAVIAMMIFSVLIITMIYTNFMTNYKVRIRTLSTIYLVETLEKIGIAKYDEVTSENTENFMPSNMRKNYEMTIEIYEDVEEILNESGQTELPNEQIIKKVVAKVTYQLSDKKYEYTMERIKIKE